MNRNWSARIFAAAVFGVTLGFYEHYRYVGWSRLGRQAYIAHAVQDFDLYMAPPRPMFLTVFAAAVLAAGVFALYEVFAIGFSAIWKWLRPQSPKSSTEELAIGTKKSD
jgi:hypothetical protein